jgi:hypothetical protein
MSFGKFPAGNKPGLCFAMLHAPVFETTSPSGITSLLYTTKIFLESPGRTPLNALV